MTTLCDRLRAATAGSRDLDAAIALAAGWERTRLLRWWRQPGDALMVSQPPEYTTSLDAITALIHTRGLLWSGSTMPGEPVEVWRDGDYANGGTLLDTPVTALALCAALAMAEEW